MGAGIYFSCTGSHLCPATVVLNYLAVRSGDEGPLFVFNDGRYLSRQRLVFHLRTTLRSCRPAALTLVYISGSFHIRVATSAASIGSLPPLCENPKGTTSVHLRTANWSVCSTFRLQTTVNNRCTCIYPATVHTIKQSLPHWKVDDCLLNLVIVDEYIVALASIFS